MYYEFFCISNYNNDLDWLSEYPNPHLIYDKTWKGGVVDNDNSGILPPSNLRKNIHITILLMEILMDIILVII